MGGWPPANCPWHLFSRMENASNMPFDGKRMISGGFVPVVSLPA